MSAIRSKLVNPVMVHDLFWVVATPLVAVLVRERGAISDSELPGTQVYLVASFAAALLIFPAFSLHRQLWSRVSLPEAERIILATACSVVLATFIAFLIERHEGVSRIVPLLHFTFLSVALLGSRAFYRLHHDRRAEDRREMIEGNGLLRAPEYALVVGTGLLTELYLRILRRASGSAVEVSGILDENPARHHADLNLIPILGHPADVEHHVNDLFVRGINVERIVVCCKYGDLSRDSIGALERIAQVKAIRLQRIDDLFLPIDSVARRSDLAMDMRDELASSGIAIDRLIPAETRRYLIAKPYIDATVAGIALIALAPVFVAVAALVAVSIGSPVLFWQKRPGYRGREFKVYKFRTMRPGYDSHGARIPDDLRQTRTSRFLRRTRLDELPQIYNIMIGDMAFVGPRPLLYVDQPRGASLRLQLRPGVTGWAQVNGGKLVDPDEKLALDLWYARHASPALDAIVLYRSLLMIVRGDGREQAAISRAVDEITRLDSRLGLGTRQ